MQLLTLRNLKVAALTAVISVGTLISTAQAADQPLTEIYADNNGITLLVSASSDHEVISMNLRVVGPNDYVAEERVESDIFEWIPEGSLPDGLYNWEAWVVTIKPGAETIEPIGFGQTTEVATQSNIEISEENHQDSPKFNNNRQADIPVERFYRSQDKHVKQVSGQFLIEHGLMKPIEDQSPESLSGAFSSADSPGFLQRFAGTVLNFLIPSAHAQVGNYSSMTLDSTNTSGPYLDYGTNSNSHWIIRGNADRYRIWDAQTGSEPFHIQSGAAENALHIRGQGIGQSQLPQIGIGTSAPTHTLHIGSGRTRIRLEDKSQSQSWYINNFNQGRFEISDVAIGIAPFTIEPGAPGKSLHVRSNGYVGIGTDNPQSSLHVEGFNNLRMLDFQWTVDPLSAFLRGPGGGTAFQVMDAPNNSLSIDVNGNVGIGVNGYTGANASLHVSRSDGSAQVLVEDTQASNTTLLNLVNNGHPRFRMDNTATGDFWEFRTTGSGSNNAFSVNKVGTPTQEFRVFGGGDVLIQGTLQENSSRATKQQIADLTTDELLAKLSSLAVQEWSYTKFPDRRHIGPMAEDFYAAFGLGNSDKHISPRDLAGVALASAKALQERNRDLEDRIERLELLLTTEL